jgi:HlyD family secretion protein
LTPELVQANALSAIAYAEKAVDDAQRQLEILTAPPSQSAIDQAYANMLLAENTLNQTLEDIARIERKKKGKMPAFMPLEVQKEIKGAYKDALKALELKRTQDQTRYESAIAKYNNLLMPPDPIDVAEAEAELTTAQAQLAEAQRDWEQVKDGPSPGEIAVLEAQLDDAQREWERLKEGPDPDDVAAAEVRVAAAEAALAQVAVAAPFDGVVTVVGNQPGDKISSGDQAFRVDDVSRFLVDVEVSEIDINQVWIGQEVGVTFEAIPGREYHGEVVEVALVGSEVQGIVSFMTTVELSDPDEAVKPGMTAAVSIVITGRE